MKKILLSLVVPLVFMMTLSAQILQEQADEIVQQRLESETKPYCLYAQKEVQTEFEITTATGEVLELGYSAWVYYVSYTGEANGKYLIVKENNGNLLEVNTKNDADPDDLEKWRFVPIEILFEEYSLEGTSCQWINLNYLFDDNAELIIINNNEELGNYISCTEGSYPEIDFSKYTLLLASGRSWNYIEDDDKRAAFFKIARDEYTMNVIICQTIQFQSVKWQVSILVSKIANEETITLDVWYGTYGSNPEQCF